MDLTTDVRLLRNRAKKGDAEAQRILGMRYKEGLGLPQDTSEAVRLFGLAADGGDVIASSILGGLYMSGGEGGVPKVRSSCRSSKRHYGGLHLLIPCCCVWQDHAEAVRLLRLAASKDHADAQMRLGEAFAYGWGVPQDFAEAARQYRLAANQGHTIAQRLLGEAHHLGKGVPRDDAEAARWFRLAADKSDAPAQTSLGALHLQGLGVSQDTKEAIRLFRLAAEQGDANAHFNLGVCLNKGEGVPQDCLESVRLFRLAAEQGHMDAHIALGNVLVAGVPGQLPAAPREAAHFLARAAQQGDDPRQRALALKILGANAHVRDVVTTCCIGCGAMEELKLCTNCHVASFCGRECLARAWPAHKEGCRMWAGPSTADREAARHTEVKRRPLAATDALEI